MPWLFEHPIVRVEGVPVQTAAGAELWARLHMPDWVNVIPVTADGQLVLVRQPRCGIGATTLEIPGGCVEPGEDPAAAAARELREETGWDGPLTALGSVWSNPAIQTNRTHLFLARPVGRIGAPTPDAGEEDLSVELHPVERLRSLLDDGIVDHALAVVSLERALRRGLL